jgi:hypothetical protein
MWLTSPLLGRGTPTDGRTAPVTCTSEISDKQVHEVLNAARRSAATVREWREAADTTSKLQGNQYENYTSDSKNDRNVAQDRAEAASVLAERIACVAKHAATGTLAAMASMFRELGAHITDHATANIVRALSEIGAAASFTAIDRCVAGEADAAILPHAVHVLRYEDYDLQTSDLLVCLDLHSKGIAAPPLDDGVHLTRQEMLDANFTAYFDGKPQPYTATQVARGRVLSEDERMQAEVAKVFGELASTYSNEKGL